MTDKTELIKRYIFLLVGLFVNGLGVSFITKAGLGTSPITSIPYTLSLGFTPTVGMFTLVFNIFLVILQVILLRRNFQLQNLLQLPIIALFSFFIDLTMSLLGFMQPETYAMKVVSLIVGCLILGFGVFMEMVANVAMLPGEATVRAVSDVFSTDFGKTKIALKGLMDNAVVETISTIDFYKGNINGVETVVAVAGVGKVNAAVCAQTMILKYSPDIMINVGVAGGLSEEFKIGDIAVADSVVEHDMDTSPIGDPVGLISGINLVNIPCDKKLADLMEQAVSKVGTITSKRGVIASGDQFISKQEQRDRIKDNFGAIAAEMEGASIGHVCYMNGVPFGVLRAISRICKNGGGKFNQDYT